MKTPKQPGIKNYLGSHLAMIVMFFVAISLIFLSFGQKTISRANDAEFTKKKFEFTINYPEIETQNILEGGQAFTKATMAEASYTTEPGKPRLPLVSQWVHVPFDAINIELKILDSTYQEQALESAVVPTKQPVIRKDTDGLSYSEEEFVMDQDFYQNSTSYYPENQVKIAELGNMRDVRYVVVESSPVRYNPSDNSLQVASQIKIEVSWDTKNNIKKPKAVPSSFKKILDKKIVNKSKLEETLSDNTIYAADTGLPIPPPPPPPAGSLTYLTNLTSLPSRVEYLIVSADLFYTSDELNVIAKYHSKGNERDVTVVNVEDIYTAVGNIIPVDPDLSDIGDDKDLKIKTYIKYVYDAKPELEYVLLVGDGYYDQNNDDYHLPTHESTMIVESQNILSDYWYSCLNDDDTSGTIDDQDGVADLYIGRFSARTLDQLGAMSEKTKAYGNMTPTPGEDWLSTALLTSGFHSSDFTNDLPTIYHQYLDPYGLQSYEVYADLYENGCMPDCDTEFQQVISDMSDSIDNGSGFLHIHNSHGAPRFWQIGTSGNWYDTAIVSQLQNNTIFPMSFSLACQTGALNYHLPSLGAAFLQNPDGGAVAFLGASIDSYSSVNQPLMNNILYSMLSDDDYLLSSSILEGKLALSGYSHLEHRAMYNLFGDPALDFSHIIERSGIAPYKHLGNGTKPYIRDNKITYLDSEGALALYNLGNDGLYGTSDDLGETQIANPSGMLEVLSHGIFENKIVWTENLNNETLPGYLNYYDLGTDGLPGTADDVGPLILQDSGGNILAYTTDIYGTMIVYRDYQSSSESSIRGYELGTDGLPGTADDMIELQLSGTSEEVYNPSIHGGLIAWMVNNTTTDKDLVFYNLGSDMIFGTADDVTATTMLENYDQDNYIIYDNTVVWEDNRGTYNEVYFYDLGPDGAYGTADDGDETQVSSRDYSEHDPSIEGNNVVFHNAYGVMYMIDLLDILP